MKNVQKAEKIGLDKLISEIKKGSFVIPDFQRDFEWKPWDVRDLIKSVFKDYYIGTLLLWKGSKNNFEYLSCQPLFGYAGHTKQTPEYIVLDGQQRLTALHYAFFAPDKNFPNRKNPYLFFLDIRELLNENFDDAFWYDRTSKYYRELLDNPEQQYADHILPLKIFSEGSWGVSDWIKGYRDYWDERARNYAPESEEYELDYAEEEAKSYFESANDLKQFTEDLLRNYEISYIELDREIDIAKVCDIFTQINSKGVQLDIFDLLNAMLRPKNVFLKEMWHDAKNDLAYTDSSKMKIYVLQVMSILLQTYCAPQYLYYLVPQSIKTIREKDGTKQQVVLIENEQEFKKKWIEAFNAIKKTIASLKNPRDFGAIKADFVPYPSIIPVLSAIKRHVEVSDYKAKVDINQQIRQWYWASIFLSRYSSSVESTAAKDFTDLKKWFNDPQQPLECVKDVVRFIEEMDFKRLRKGSAIYTAIFNMLILNEARDWYTYELPEYDSLDDHHIVPQSWGKKNVGDDINSIMNRVPLSADTNRKIIRDTLPNLYLKEMFTHNNEEEIYNVLESHLISKECVEILLREPFTKEDYYDFITEREKTVSTYIKEKIFNAKGNE